MKALIVEDDIKMLTYISKGLKEEGFTIDSTPDGAEGLYLAQMNEYDIFILDWNLPTLNGLQICQLLRKQKIITPILMLTAKNDMEDKIKCLESGIDDYMTKPFVFRELIARINSLIRRSNYSNEDIIIHDTLEVNIPKRTVKRANQNIELTSKEFGILIYLLNSKGSVVTHTKIQEKIWGMDEVSASNVVNVFVHHLRKKIDIEGELPLIKTVRGSGYKIESIPS